MPMPQHSFSITAEYLMRLRKLSRTERKKINNHLRETLYHLVEEHTEV